jgi:hypothetical protein
MNFAEIALFGREVVEWADWRFDFAWSAVHIVAGAFPSVHPFNL